MHPLINLAYVGTFGEMGFWLAIIKIFTIRPNCFPCAHPAICNTHFLCQIQIELKGPLARFGEPGKRDGRITLLTPQNATVLDVLKMIHVPEKYVGLILLNGQKSRLTACLEHGDAVTIYPVVAGG